MEVVGGVVAPEDLVNAGDGVSSDHLPLAAVAAHVRPPGGVDLLARGSAELHEGHAIAAPQQLGVALGFNDGVIVEDRAYNRGRGADAVTGASGESEGNGFIGFDHAVRRRIHHDGSGGGSSGEGGCFGGGCCRNAGVIGSQRCSAAHCVVDRESGGNSPASEEGIN